MEREVFQIHVGMNDGQTPGLWGEEKTKRAAIREASQLMEDWDFVSITAVKRSLAPAKPQHEEAGPKPVRATGQRDFTHEPASDEA